MVKRRWYLVAILGSLFVVGIGGCRTDIGGKCDNAEACNEGLVCLHGECFKLGEVGAKCELAEQCVDGLVCHKHECFALRNKGGTCQESAECAQGLVCHNGSCFEPGKDGATCVESADCLDGLTCYKDKCLTRRQEGLPCQESAECARDLVCYREKCFAKRKDGESCQGSAECIDGHACLGGNCHASETKRAVLYLAPAYDETPGKHGFVLSPVPPKATDSVSSSDNVFDWCSSHAGSNGGGGSAASGCLNYFKLVTGEAEAYLFYAGLRWVFPLCHMVPIEGALTDASLHLVVICESRTTVKAVLAVSDPVGEMLLSSFQGRFANMLSSCSGPGVGGIEGKYATLAASSGQVEPRQAAELTLHLPPAELLRPLSSADQLAVLFWQDTGDVCGIFARTTTGPTASDKAGSQPQTPAVSRLDLVFQVPRP